MSEKYFLRSKALSDLSKIVSYISLDNPVAARKLRELILETCSTIGENPYIGQQRMDLSKKPVRFLPVHNNYMIVYNPSTKPVQILRVYNAARHIDNITH